MDEAVEKHLGKPIIGVAVRGSLVHQISDQNIVESERFPFSGFPPTISVVAIPQDRESLERFSLDIVNLIQTSGHHARSYEIPIPEGQGNQPWTDEHGILFGSVTIKGNNLEDPHVQKDQYSPSGFRINGMLESDTLARVIMVSAFLRSIGVETEKTEAVVKPEELVFDGKKIPIDEFKRLLLERAKLDAQKPPDFNLGSLTGQQKSKKVEGEDLARLEIYLEDLNPVFIVRALQVPERPRDLEEAQTAEEFNNVLSRTFAFINIRETIEAAKENRTPHILSIDNPDDVEFYFTDYLPTRLAINIARMHNAGLTHGFLTSHNVSLAGSIYDLDSVYGKALGDNMTPNQQKDIVSIIDEMGSIFTPSQQEARKARQGSNLPYMKQALGEKFLPVFFQRFIATYLTSRDFGIDFSSSAQSIRQQYVDEYRRNVSDSKKDGLGSDTLISELNMEERESGMTVDQMARKTAIEQILNEAFRSVVPHYPSLFATTYLYQDNVRDAVEKGYQDALETKTKEIDQVIDPDLFTGIRSDMEEFLRVA